MPECKVNRRNFMKILASGAGMAALPAVARAATAGNGGKSAAAPGPLVAPEWLRARLGNEGIVILDVTSTRFYARGHIPGAVFSAYESWREKRNGVPGMMLAPEKLQAMISALGIGNEDHVVIVPAGYSSGDVGMATRVYWSLKTMGHERVSLLEGGMRVWLSRKGYPLQQAPVRPRPKAFEARFTNKWLATAADVEKALAEKAPQLIDNRPVGQHKGVFKSGSVLKYGTLPGAINVPEDWLAHRGRLLTRAQAEKLHALLGVGPGPAIHFCNTGHRASLGWFVRSEILGQPSRLYDGSLAEWTRLDPATHPVVAALPIHDVKQ
jgi:thiosulfate/3-mercaptopyruvate sulfurtransferase